jgi:hypothetical protein
MGELSETEVFHPALDPSLSRSRLGTSEDGGALDVEHAKPSVLPVGGSGDPAKPAMAPLAEVTGGPQASDPAVRRVTPLLRLWRLLASIAMLALAWGFLLVLLMLTTGAWSFVHGSRTILLRAGASAGAALLVLWLLVAVTACLFAGAYSLLLAVTRRGW